MANYQFFSCINGTTLTENELNSNNDHISVKNVLSETRIV